MFKQYYTTVRMAIIAIIFFMISDSKATSQSELFFLNDSNLVVTAYKDYQEIDKLENAIILIDSLKQDTLIKLRITASYNIDDIFYKRPHKYYMEGTNLILVYSQDYLENENNDFYDEILHCAITILGYPENIKFDWEKNSFLQISGDYEINGMFNPDIVEYCFANDKLVFKSFVDSMFYTKRLKINR